MAGADQVANTDPTSNAALLASRLRRWLIHSEGWLDGLERVRRDAPPIPPNALEVQMLLNDGTTEWFRVTITHIEEPGHA